MTRFSFCRAWLMLACISTVVLGLLMVFFNQSAAFVWMNAPMHRVFWPDGDMTPAVIEFHRWVYGTWGAATAAMGVLAVPLVSRGFSRREKWARDTLGTGILVWYLLDSLASLRGGVIVNAISNTVILASFGIPLLLSWQDFASTTRDSR
jgi:hypothetical protein